MYEVQLGLWSTHTISMVLQYHGKKGDLKKK